MTQHTPGPWAQGYAGAMLDWPEVRSASGDLIARTYGGKAAPDARLIAAAPKLLAALQEVAEYMGEPMQMTPGNVQAAVVNALIAARTMTGADNRTVKALPHDLLQEVLRKYNRLASVK